MSKARYVLGKLKLLWSQIDHSYLLITLICLEFICETA